MGGRGECLTSITGVEMITIGARSVFLPELRGIPISWK